MESVVSLLDLVLVALLVHREQLLELLLDLSEGHLHIHPQARRDDVHVYGLAWHVLLHDFLVPLLDVLQGGLHLARLSRVLGEAHGEGCLGYHFFEEILLVEKHEEGGLGEQWVLDDWWREGGILRASGVVGCGVSG
jgi:hypothetical protein